LHPFIDNLWDTNQQSTLKELSIPLLNYFLLKKQPDGLESLLSYHFIFDWYERYNWTKNWVKSDWELFFYDVSGVRYTLDSEISGKNEFQMKLECFVKFRENNALGVLLLPLFRYDVKNNYNEGTGEFGFVPDIIDDDYEIPKMHFNHDSFA